MGCASSTPAVAEAPADPSNKEAGAPDKTGKVSDPEQARRSHAITSGPIDLDVAKDSTDTDEASNEASGNSLAESKDQNAPSTPETVAKPSLAEILSGSPAGGKNRKKNKYKPKGTVLGEESVEEDEPEFFDNHDQSESRNSDGSSSGKDGSGPLETSPRTDDSGDVRSKKRKSKKSKKRKKTRGDGATEESALSKIGCLALPLDDSPDWSHGSKSQLSYQGNDTIIEDRSEYFQRAKAGLDPYDNFASSMRASEHRDEARKLYTLLCYDPPGSRKKLADAQVIEVIDDCPEACSVKYAFEGFSGEVYPLSILSALGASRKALAECFDAYPKQLTENDEWVGTPLHYACSYRAPRHVLEFLIKKNLNSLSETNQFHRTPLHMACLSKAPTECVTMLIEKHPAAAEKRDREGMVPIHIACKNGGEIEVIKELLRWYPLACSERSLIGATPLHLAAAHNASIEILELLLDMDETALKIEDEAGRIPLHHAVSAGADLATVDLLLIKFPDGAKCCDRQGETPIELAQRHANVKPEVLERLRA